MRGRPQALSAHVCCDRVNRMVIYSPRDRERAGWEPEPRRALHGMCSQGLLSAQGLCKDARVGPPAAAVHGEGFLQVAQEGRSNI